jgi:hypothetical protein
MVTKTHRSSGFICAILFVSALLMSAVRTADAALLMNVQVNASSFLIPDNSAIDTNPGTGVLNANTAIVNSFLASIGAPYEFTSLSATSNAIPGGSPISDSMISISGSIRSALPDPPSIPVTITVSDTNFIFPALPGIVTSGAADTFAFTTPGDSRTFQSFYDPTNTGIPAGTSTPLITFIPPTGAGPFAFSQTNGASIPVPVIPYALVNQTVINLVPGVNPADLATDNFSGITIVSVPEPASLGLLSVGIGGLLLKLRRRFPAA